MSIDFKPDIFSIIGIVTKKDVFRDRQGYWVHSLMDESKIYFNVKNDSKNFGYEPEFVRSLMCHSSKEGEKHYNFCRIDLVESKDYASMLTALSYIIYTLHKDYKDKKFHLCICFELNLFGILEIRD